MNPGYAMFDGTGIDLSAGSAKTIAGIHAKAITAMATKKPIIISGVVNSTAAVTPISATAKMSSTSVVLSFGIFTVTITNADSVTVAEYSPTTRMAKK